MWNGKARSPTLSYKNFRNGWKLFGANHCRGNESNKPWKVQNRKAWMKREIMVKRVPGLGAWYKHRKERVALEKGVGNKETLVWGMI